MNHKYTLCCNKGCLFKSEKHFLILDRWILPSVNTSLLILSHGIMSEVEYRHFLTQKLIPIFQGVSFAWIGLYPAHESKKYSETQFAGYLVRETENEWGGFIHVG